MNSWIKRYWLPTILVTVGLITALIGIGSATIWAPPSKVTATSTSKANTQLVNSAPGVLSLYSSPVQIEISGNGNTALAIGRSSDINGWINNQPHQQINGLASLTELKTVQVNGKDKPLPLDTNGATDMWSIYKTSSTGKISMTWPQNKGNWSIVAYSEKGPVKVSLGWQHKQTQGLFYTLLTVGLILVAAGFILGFVLYRIAAAAQKEWEETQKRRKAMRELSRQQAMAPETLGIPITAEISTVSKRPSRKELREARNRGEESIKVDGVEYPTGLMPTIKLDESGNPINPASKASEVVSECATDLESPAVTEAEDISTSSEIDSSPEAILDNIEDLKKTMNELAEMQEQPNDISTAEGQRA